MLQKLFFWKSHKNYFNEKNKELKNGIISSKIVQLFNNSYKLKYSVKSKKLGLPVEDNTKEKIKSITNFNNISNQILQIYTNSPIINNNKDL